MDDFCKVNLPDGVPQSLYDLSNEQLICASYVTTASITSKAISTASGVAGGIDVFFLIFSAALVFLMQAGFAMLTAGCVRQKNVQNILFKNLLDACGGAIGFWSIGFAFAYGGENENKKNFIGDNHFFLIGIDNAEGYIMWFFQFSFAAAAATIVAGTIAERCKMQAYLCYSFMLTGFVYPVIVRSIWSQSGFLSAFNSKPFNGVGVIDFAGSGVVHLTGGYTALIAAKILGPRLGRFHDIDGKPLERPHNFPPHSVALQVLGTFVLWFGWYGFNPGSALKISSSGYADVAALCCVTTTISAASGCVTACFTDMLINRLKTAKIEYDVSMAVNGSLGALVGITAGCSVVTPGVACVIGIISGWVYLGFSKLLLKLKIDDAVDAIPVHFANGIWGVLAVGLFAEPSRTSIAYGDGMSFGAFYGGNGTLLANQIVEVFWIVGWVSLTMIPFFFCLNWLGFFRVSRQEELVGLDLSHHKGHAYNLSESTHSQCEEDAHEVREKTIVFAQGGGHMDEEAA